MRHFSYYSSFKHYGWFYIILSFIHYRILDYS